MVYHYLALNIKKNLVKKIIDKLTWKNCLELYIANIDVEIVNQYLALKFNTKTIYRKELMKNCVPKKICLGLYDVNVLSRICPCLGYVRV